MARSMWVFIITVGYLIVIIKEIYASVKDIYTVKAYDFQNMQVELAGFGGNIPALIIGPIVLGSLMVLYGTTLAALFGTLTGGFNWSSLVGLINHSPLAGMTDGDTNHGMRLVSSTFPVAFAFGMMGTYIVWRLTIGKITVIACGIVKWLVGG